MRPIAIISLLAFQSITFGDQLSDNFYKSIRGGDHAALRTLAKSASANAADGRGTTALMMAAAYGDLESMKILVEAGANVNAENEFGATALLWCAADAAKVEFLLTHGAAAAQSKLGRTPLLLASRVNGNAKAVRLLLEKEAAASKFDNMGNAPLTMAANAGDPDAVRLLLAAKAPAGHADKAGLTALMGAASNGSVEVAKLLLAQKANINDVAIASPPPMVKNGNISLDHFTPLNSAAAYGSPELIKLLLDAGADVNALDVRGITPLIFAIASDRPDARVVRLLLANGADVSIRGKDGLTALDWAKKYNNPQILSALGLKTVPVAAASLNGNPAEAAIAPAIGRGISLLQKVSGSFFATGGCAACHAQNITGLLLSEARAKGLPFNEQAAMGGLKGEEAFWRSYEQSFLQLVDPPGAFDTVMYALQEFAAGHLPASSTTDAMVHYLAATQAQDGRWHGGTVARPPIEDGDISRTAQIMRCLQLYEIPGRKAEFDGRVARAAKWIEKSPARNTEDLNMQLLTLVWTSASRAAITSLAKRIEGKQRADGGWAQTDHLSSDAYATGQTMYALQQANAASPNRTKRGVAFLLGTQKSDGSWYVQSRALKFQPYFQSGFPYDHDQWISMAATAWANIGLAQALPAKVASTK